MKRRWQPSGIVSLDPTSFFWMLDPFEPPANESSDGVGIVHVRGPLEHHAAPNGYCDTYDAILGRVRLALESKPKALVLAIDSPGGLAAGNAESAREIRAACDAAGVPLVAYCHGLAASAAYGLACVAHEVVTPPSGMLGSIGTMVELMDVTEGDAAWGVKVHVVSSGDRKLDGNPRVAQTDERIAEIQKIVDALAAVFFGLVSEFRPLSVAAIRAMEGAIYVGADAVAAKLADSVATLPALIARLSGAAPDPKTTAPASAEETPMDEEEKKARAALQAVVDDEKSDEKAKARAAAALKALDATDDAEGDGKGDEDSEGKGAEKSVASRALAGVSRLESLFAKDREERQQAEVARQKAADALEVKAQLDARPDLTDEQRTAFAKLAPSALAEVLAALPKAPRKNPAAASQVQFTRGENAGSTVSPRVADIKSKLGLGKRTFGVVQEGNVFSIGAPVAQKGA